MKRIFAIILSAIIIVTIFAGCAPENELSKTYEYTAKSGAIKTKQDYQEVKKQNKSDGPTDKTENIEPAEQTSPATEPISAEIDPETAPEVPNAMWTAEETLEFALSGNVYAIGDPCKAIMNDYTVVEIGDGHIRDDGTVPVCEKVAVKLVDEQGREFIIVIRNDMDQAMPLEECTLHEILVEAEFYDLSDFKVMNTVNGNEQIDKWMIAFGAEYREYVHDDWASYDWEVLPKCWVDVCIDVETNEVLYVQMMTY